MRILYVILCGLFLAGCSQTGGNSAVPAGLPNGGASTVNAALGSGPSIARQPSGNHGYKLLYGFTGSPDGGFPGTGLLTVNGTLYGTTEYGGVASGSGGLGTIFTVSTSGQESVLYSFGSSKTDGTNPYGSLVEVNGEIYGTTYSGGKGNGTVFKMNTSGKEVVLYRFKGAPDGAQPEAGLIAVNGLLYGTTYSGGANNSGTVFEVTTSGQEQVLHSFGSSPADGTQPYAGLVAVKGTLYGTTFLGGTTGVGTAFKVSRSGKEVVLHTFGTSAKDGAQPYGGLIALNGQLYGTTINGGKNSSGTVFQMSTSGTERVIHNFKGSPDGAQPFAGLIALNGQLYGTTYNGGNLSAGTAFKLSTSGTERVLYSFAGSPDGGNPHASLIALNGELYGTTISGGVAGYGTVFTVSP